MDIRDPEGTRCVARIGYDDFNLWWLKPAEMAALVERNPMTHGKPVFWGNVGQAIAVWPHPEPNIGIRLFDAAGKVIDGIIQSAPRWIWSKDRGWHNPGDGA